MRNLKFFWLIFILTYTMSYCQSKQVNAFDVRQFESTPAFEVAKAVQDEDTIKVSQAIRKNPELLSFQEKRFGHSLLSFAVITGKLQAVKNLLRLGADANQKADSSNLSPFLYACRFASSIAHGNEILQHLIRHGADLNSSFVDSSLDQFGRKKMFKSSPLELVCRYGNLQAVRLLINSGADPFRYPSNGEKSLVNASLPNLDILKYLLMEVQLPIPNYCVIRNKGLKKEAKLTITDILNEKTFEGKEYKKDREEILRFLKQKRKR